eukprot:TRINITY_DN1270_c0_g1_i1.p1 TRINITY_DN1270_c0_g1~~TRINITY_DN1270_c0_g1_i1.p1  ORF type:complete len:204 (+),score=106.65 TRINITY_DN1270_c0_g1_i1:87-698(+)
MPKDKKIKIGKESKKDKKIKVKKEKSSKVKEEKKNKKEVLKAEKKKEKEDKKKKEKAKKEKKEKKSKKVKEAEKPTLEAEPVEEVIPEVTEKAVEEPKEVDNYTDVTTHKPEKKKRKAPPPNTPFRRVKSEEIKILDERLKDVSYEALGDGGFGKRCNDKLKDVRGKRFRHEKNKLKKKSYFGGILNDYQVNAFTYPDSSDEE